MRAQCLLVWLLSGAVLTGSVWAQSAADEQARASEAMTDRWGALATDPANSILGGVTGLSSQEAATQAALQACKAKGGVTCKLEFVQRNQCGALVVGDRGYATGVGVTPEIAAEQAIGVCRKDGDYTCEVYYSACSFPSRAQ